MKAPRIFLVCLMTSSILTACGGGGSASDGTGLLSSPSSNNENASSTQNTPPPSATPQTTSTPAATTSPQPTSTPGPQPTLAPEPSIAPTMAPQMPQPTATPVKTFTPTPLPTQTSTPMPTATPVLSATPSPTAAAQPTTAPTPTVTPVENGTSEVLEKERELTDTPEMAAVKSAISTRGNSVVSEIFAGNPTNPENVKRVESIISASDWEFLFPERSPEYTYENFLKAIGKFEGFCSAYTDGRDSDAICRKVLATMFAHFTQETGGHTAHWDVPEWRQGLVHVREMGWNEDMRGGYNGECNPSVWQGQTWPCGTFANGDFKSYFGRGAKQLSYNYNYGPFSEAMFGDVRVLLDNPELVADTWLNIASAVFFFVYPQPPKPAMLHVIDGTWQPNTRDIANGLTPGFGVTTQIINGGVECGGSVEIQQSINRIDYYRNFAQHLGVPIPADEVLGCAGMQQFDAQGNGALNIYWEQDWSWVAGNPDGQSFACKLVGYQTPFSAFKEGDYRLCVEHHFGYVLEEGDDGEELTEPTLPTEPTVSVTPTPVVTPVITATPTVTPITTPTTTPIVTPVPTTTPTATPTVTPTPAPVVTNPDLSGVDYAEFNKVYQQDSGKVIASYFVEWGIYGRNYHVQDIPAANLTHLLFGFIAICGDNPHASGGARAAIQRECADKQDYEVTMIDRFANLEKTYPGDTWIDDVSGSNYNGNFGQLKKLKAQYPHLTILPSVGGWTLSTPFYAMAKDPAKRTTFVNSVVAFITKYDFFDGVDLDWEYPVYGGTDPHLSAAEDSAGYVALMRELREAFDALSAETGRTYEITSAVGAPPEKISAVDYATAQQYMDYIFIMTYDFHGAWDATTGHHAALHHYEGNTPGWNGADAAQNMLNAGVPANKIVIGGAFYGRGWRGNQNTNNSANYPLFGEAAGAITGTWEAGVLDWRDIYNNFVGPNNTGINGFTVFYDEAAQAPYAWNPGTGEFVTYDSPRSLRTKAEYVLDHSLGGMLSWEIDADNGLLLNAINEGLGNSEVR